ncbi:hypothetical protein KJ780_05380, partial [Candidatus Micrarchaeota archaeon]|nr:hypothetical protein [Candidatus Micrarchaeota archaeon]
MKKTPGKLNSPKAAEPAGSRRKEFAAGKPFIEKETRIHPKTRAALIRAIKGPQLSNALLALEEMITYYDEKKAVVILGKIACDENVFLREVKIWAVEILYERYGDLDAMWKIWGDALDGKVQALASQKIALMDRKIPKTDEHPSITRIRRADITYLRKMSSDPSMLAMIAKNNQKLVYYALDILLGMKDK